MEPSQLDAKGPYQKIEDEAQNWKGKGEVDFAPFPELEGVNNRKEWWGVFAEKFFKDRSFTLGMTSILETLPLNKRGVAVELGSGLTFSPIFLLRKGWKVICVDYSEKALTAMRKMAEVNIENGLGCNQLQLHCSAIEDYQFRDKVDLVIASSSLSYCNPKKIEMVMRRIFNSLSPSGLFVGNFFATKYAQSALENLRKMGGWFLEDESDVVHLLRFHGYKILRCSYGGDEHPASVVFVAQKIGQHAENHFGKEKVYRDKEDRRKGCQIQ